MDSPIKRFFTAGLNSIAILENVPVSEIEDEMGRIIGKKNGEIIRKYKSGSVAPGNDIIEKLTIDAVKRGHMDRIWAELFLESSKYPNKKALLDSIFSSEQSLEKISHFNNNLPSPDYPKFVMRDYNFDRIIEGLKNRSAIVLIRSLGGNGKTSLALEIAKQCISLDPQYNWLPKFKTAVWVSDKNNPARTNLDVVLDTIAKTLGYEDILKDPFEEKKHRITQILGRQNILLVIDNYETIKDHALSEWLTNVFPEPSKCIITTREYHMAFRDNTKNIELKGMDIEEARVLIANKGRSIELRIERVEDFDSLITTFGGNPKAIEMALGIIKHGRTLKESIEKVIRIEGELFCDLFSKAWDLLNLEEKKLLQLMSMFPYGTNEPALIEILQISDSRMKIMLDKLNDLSLVNREINKQYTEIYYYLHPLVNIFAALKFNLDSEKTVTISKWKEYYIKLSNQISHCWDKTNTIDLKILDADCLKEGLEYSITWAIENKEYDYAIKVTNNVKYYFYIRGLWSSSLKILKQRAEAAKEKSNYQIEFDAYVDYFNLLCKQENIKDAENYLTIVQSLESKYKNELSRNSLIDLNHSIALYHLMKGEYEKSIDLWTQNLENKFIDNRQIGINNRWLGIAYFKNNDFYNAKKYIAPIAEKIQSSEDHNSLSAHLCLCKIYLEENNEDVYESISLGLKKSKGTKDNFNTAEFEFLVGKYYRKRGENGLAKEHFINAISIFDKNGCFDKVIFVKKEMREIDLL